MSDDKDVFVYVIGTVREGKVTAPCKIGISATPNARVWALQTACPDELKLICAYRMPNREIALQVEDCFHYTQKAHRLRGEWFKHDPAFAANLLKFQIIMAFKFFSDLSEEELTIAHEFAGLNA